MIEKTLQYAAIFAQFGTVGYLIFSLWRSNRKQKEFEKETKEILEKYREAHRQETLRRLYSPGGGVH